MRHDDGGCSCAVIGGVDLPVVIGGRHEADGRPIGDAAGRAIGIDRHDVDALRVPNMDIGNAVIREGVQFARDALQRIGDAFIAAHLARSPVVKARP